MKLSTVIASVNNNPNYYLFIPKQIIFWNHFNIKFVAIFVGEQIPTELMEYKNNIILWNKNLDLNTAFVAQNIRIYYPALLSLPDDEMVMITDMDMLPTNDKYYKENLELYNKEDFIYYRYIDGNQIYMCYNAAHPETWGKIFNIKTDKDIELNINNTYNNNYNGIPGLTGWFIDQEMMYLKLKNYPFLKILNKPIKRLEMNILKNHVLKKDINYVTNYDDAHFHRSYPNNKKLIEHVEKELRINNLKQ
jgi:hypothetical protein